MTLSAAAAASTNLMLHLIKTTKDEPRMPDDTPEKIWQPMLHVGVWWGGMGWGVATPPFPPYTPATKNSQAMAGSIHAPLVRIELCYFCPPVRRSCLVLCLLSCVFCLRAVSSESQSPCGCCYVSGYHSYSCRRALHPIQIPMLGAICYMLDIDVDIQHRRTRYSLSGR